AAFGAGEVSLNQPRALVRPLVGQERDGLLERGDHAAHIERKTAKELRVGCPWRRLDFGGALGTGEVIVDLRGRQGMDRRRAKQQAGDQVWQESAHRRNLPAGLSGQLTPYQPHASAQIKGSLGKPDGWVFALEQRTGSAYRVR